MNNTGWEKLRYNQKHCQHCTMNLLSIQSVCTVGMMKVFLRLQKSICNDEITTFIRSTVMSVIGQTMLIATMYYATGVDLNIML